MPPRAAYVHVPFCAHRCGYCNFALVADRLDLAPAYLDAVSREMQDQLGSPQEVDTLYFGGGTPTQLGPYEFSELAAMCKRWHPLAAGYEWTVEANPADVNEELAQAIAAAGANRLSLGAQSFDAEKLRMLERDHQADDIARSVNLAKQHGLAVAIDLIFAVPGETLDGWHEDLRQAIDLCPQHISIYGLTFEKGTNYWNRLQRGDLVEADDELQRAMYLDAIDRLGDAGIVQYEVSNFARAGHRSRHNQTYWRGDEYFAVGPGAARYVGGGARDQPPQHHDLPCAVSWRGSHPSPSEKAWTPRRKPASGSCLHSAKSKESTERNSMLPPNSKSIPWPALLSKHLSSTVY